MKKLDYKVYPSKVETIKVKEDKNYGGAHEYLVQECAGFKDGETQYVESFQKLKFVHKDDDDFMTPGLQSEQILLVLIDRHRKLNDRFPSEYNDKMLAGMQMAVDAMEDRVRDRVERGVMGALKK